MTITNRENMSKNYEMQIEVDKLHIEKEYDKLIEHLGVVEDERNTYLKQLEEIYEAIVGADGINRYTHDEIIDRIYDLYDVYTKYVNEEEVWIVRK